VAALPAVARADPGAIGAGTDEELPIKQFDLSGIREPLADIAREAARTILSFYDADRPVAAQSKADNTPVTAADLAAHRLILDGLAPFGLPVLSEEAVAQTSERRHWDAFWMVDPLDGTREFLAANGEFSVNIALVEGHTATLGLVAIPVTGELFIGGPELGAWRCDGDDWRAIRCRAVPAAQPLVVFTSRRHRGEALESCLSSLSALAPGLERRHSGSAIKFARLAEGEADFYPRFSPCSEWDTAAGQALLEGAGGAVLTLDGEPLRYNTRDTLMSVPFHAIADPGHTLWSKLA
jgi:3'(2'), 5'-bisphosphate nucleotidase